MKLVEFLIMENLPLNGGHLEIDRLKDCVMSDFFSIKNKAESNIFELALEKLSDDQYIFINNRKKTVAATRYGINKLN